AASRADQFGLPELFVQLDRVLGRVAALPLVEDGQVVPGKQLLSGLVTVTRERLDGPKELRIDLQTEVGAEPRLGRSGGGLAIGFGRVAYRLTVQRAFEQRLAQRQHE